MKQFKNTSQTIYKLQENENMAKTMNSERSNSQSLKYQRFAPLGWKEKGI